MRFALCISLVASIVMTVSPVEGSVEDAWFEVQEALSAPDGRSPQQPLSDLLKEGEELDIRRMTPYSAALVSWSLANPDTENSILETSIELDPELPASYFLLSRRSWRQGAYLESATFYLKGWVACFQDEVVRRHLFISFGLWLIVGVAAASFATLIVMVFWTLRRTAHDAMKLGRMIFNRANAVVFGLVVLLLPLLAGLGPAWLIVYLFICGWVYFDRAPRIVAIVICVVLGLLPLVGESLQRSLLRTIPLADRVSVMLDERQLDPSTLREFLSVKEDIGGDTSYHLILGELFRMHSAVESAKVEFEIAANDPHGDSRPFVFLGNMALEDGSAQLAIRYFDLAIETDDLTALAYHNLSSAYDLNRRFEQGDTARRRARELAGGRSANLGVRGRDPRIRYPAVTSDDVDEFVSALTREELLHLGDGGHSWSFVRQLLSPISVLCWGGALVGLGVLFVRERWFRGAKECTKCGMIYRLDDQPGESTIYCRQCVSVFLQRNFVPIDQQAAKLSTVRRRDGWLAVVRRLASIVAPGSYQIINGDVGFGVFIGLLAWISLAGVTVWVPRFLEVIEPTMPVRPVVLALAFVFLAAWIQSIIASWQRR